jgi:opacity protein-like surface antigen
MIQMKRIVLAFVLLGGTTAFAQVFEIGVTGGESLLRKSTLAPVDLGGGSTVNTELTNGFRLGFRMALNTYRFFGHEFGYAYNRTQLKFETTPPQELGMAIHQGFYDFLAYALPEGSPVRPFAAGGAQFSNFVPPGASATSGGGSTKFGLNYGAGVKAKISPRFMIRFDFRQYYSPKPDFFIQAPSGWLRQIELSAGFGFAL